MRHLIRATGLALALAASPALAQNLNTQVLVTLTAQGAGTVASVDLPNSYFRGALVSVNLTTMTTATVVVHVQGKDPLSSVYYDIFTSQSLTTTGFTALEVYPGLTSTTTTYPFVLPATWRVTAVVTGGSAAATGTVGASLIQ